MQANLSQLLALASTPKQLTALLDSAQKQTPGFNSRFLSRIYNLKNYGMTGNTAAIQSPQTPGVFNAPA